MILFSVVAHPVIMRVPTATLAVIIICTAWKKVRFKAIKTAFKGNKRVLAIIAFAAMVVLGIFFDMVVVIDVVSLGALVYCFDRRRRVRKKAERLSELHEKIYNLNSNGLSILFECGSPFFICSAAALPLCACPYSLRFRARAYRRDRAPRA